MAITSPASPDNLRGLSRRDFLKLVGSISTLAFLRWLLGKFVIPDQEVIVESHQSPRVVDNKIVTGEASGVQSVEAPVVPAVNRLIEIYSEAAPENTVKKLPEIFNLAGEFFGFDGSDNNYSEVFSMLLYENDFGSKESRAGAVGMAQLTEETVKTIEKYVDKAGGTEKLKTFFEGDFDINNPRHNLTFGVFYLGILQRIIRNNQGKVAPVSEFDFAIAGYNKGQGFLADMLKKIPAGSEWGWETAAAKIDVPAETKLAVRRARVFKMAQKELLKRAAENDHFHLDSDFTYDERKICFDLANKFDSKEAQLKIDSLITRHNFGSKKAAGNQ